MHWVSRVQSRVCVIIYFLLKNTEVKELEPAIVRN